MHIPFQTPENFAGETGRDSRQLRLSSPQKKKAIQQSVLTYYYPSVFLLQVNSQSHKQTWEGNHTISGKEG